MNLRPLLNLCHKYMGSYGCEILATWLPESSESQLHDLRFNIENFDLEIEI